MADDPDQQLRAALAARNRQIAAVHVISGLLSSSLDLGRVLSTADIIALPAPAYLYDDLIVAEGLNVLVGASGTFKSFLALEIALSLATDGRDIFYIVA